MIKFREPTAEETSKIQESLHRWIGKDIFGKIFSGKVLVIGEGKIKEVFLVPMEVYNVFRKVKDIRMPYYLGLFFGEINGEFKISLEGLWLISKYSREKGVVVSDKGEQLFLYGQDILEESVIKIGSLVQTGSKVVVFNRFYEPLGLGVLVRYPSRHVKKVGHVVVKNILDRGWYLRRGK